MFRANKTEQTRLELKDMDSYIHAALNIASPENIIYLCHCNKIISDYCLCWLILPPLSAPQVHKIYTLRSIGHLFRYHCIHNEGINSSPPSAAYMRQWMGLVLVKIMACRLPGAKPLSKPMLGNHQLDTYEQASVIFFFQNTKSFIHKNASDNIVCEMGPILSRGEWVKYNTEYTLRV